MAKGIQPDDQTKERVKALLAAGKAKNQIAKEVKLAWATVDKISKENPDELEDIREQKRIEFIGRLWSSMDEALKLADKRIAIAIDANHKLDELSDAIGDAGLDPKQTHELQRALENVTAVPLGQISTFIGTIYDKHALMTGGKTADVGLTFEDQLRGLIK